MSGWHDICCASSVVIVFLFVCLHPKNKDKSVLDRRLLCSTEIGIWVIYLINIVSLVSVVARSGGPSASLYAPLIPIQLSGMIFLHIEKELFVEAGAVAPFFYTAVACILIAFSSLFPDVLSHGGSQKLM